MKIWLDGYVPPSLNVLLHAHWAKRVKMKHDTGWLVRKSVLGLGG